MTSVAGPITAKAGGCRYGCGYGHSYYGHQSYGYYEKVQLLAVERDPYNVELVGETLRAQRRASEALQATGGLTTEIVTLRQEVAQLRLAIAGGGGGAPQPQPAPPLAASQTYPTPQPATDPYAPQPQAPEVPAPAPQPMPPAPAPAPQPAPPPAPAPQPAPPPAGDELSSWGWTFLENRCASCHNARKASKGFSLFGAQNAEGRYPRLPLTAGKLILIDTVLYSNEMPMPPQPKATAVEYNRFRAWMQTFVPSIRQVARAADQ